MIYVHTCSHVFVSLALWTSRLEIDLFVYFLYDINSLNFFFTLYCRCLFLILSSSFVRISFTLSILLIYNLIFLADTFWQKLKTAAEKKVDN
jgi:hypothetical protein